MIPTPVLAEYLTAFPPDEHDTLRSIFEENFYLPPLDVAAAQVAARLLYDTDRMREIRREHGVDRQSLRTDAMIVAIAIVQKAERIVSHDARHYRKLASGEVLVTELPDIPEQETFDFDSSQ